jgi:hypothetical protein
METIITSETREPEAILTDLVHSLVRDSVDIPADISKIISARIWDFT